VFSHSEDSFNKLSKRLNLQKTLLFSASSPHFNILYALSFSASLSQNFNAQGIIFNPFNTVSNQANHHLIAAFRD
jgi:hypothetical protein